MDSKGSKYQEVIFRPLSMQATAPTIWPDQARAMVGKALHGIEFDRRLFHHNADGTAIMGAFRSFRDASEPSGWAGWSLPPIVLFDGGRGFVRLYGLGEEGSKLLRNETPKIFSGLVREHGPVAVDMREGENEIRYAGYAIPHRIRSLVVSKSPRVRYAGPVSDPRVCAVIRRQIAHGLEAQCELLGMDARDVPRNEEIDILEGEPTGGVAIASGLPVSSYKNLVVSMPVRLVGPWTVGLLRSHGCGMIRAADPVSDRRRPASAERVAA
jgi:hypothetical protein